ncbi:glutathione S-transferase family protein [Marinomonas dokdonensis]|uniref:glutathione S-transferase family protein n=1 Tax=Marinomonas dokdonensis TaxID=328224 RepID=UPI0040554AC7
MKLIIANKNYSSWSLRGWLVLKAFHVPFDEIQLSLETEEFYQILAQHTSVGKVPVLIDNDLTVWDSLAICEYINEAYLQGKGWPEDRNKRAVARSIVSEMHSGLFAIRNEMPMNCRATRRIEPTESALAEVAHVDDMWSTLRAENSKEGDYLFGEFSLADVFFAPLVFRFMTYRVAVSDSVKAYMDTMLAHPAMQEWYQAALAETEVIASDEAGEPV